MEDINHQGDVEMDINGDNNMSDNDSNDDGYVYTPGDHSIKYTRLNNNLFQGLKQNDPYITDIEVALHSIFTGDCFFNSIDWKVDGYCIANNTHIKRLRIYYFTTPNSDDHPYILGEERENLPTRQQLQDFFSCIYQNSSIKELVIKGIGINDFGGGLIEGLCGHSSLKSLEIEAANLGNLVVCSAIEKVLNHSKCKLKDLRLHDCKLDNEGISTLCYSLFGNSTIKRLSFNGNTDITRVGWWALSNVIRHPNCKLIELGLHDAGIDDESANVLGSALSGSSLKILDLSVSANRYSGRPNKLISSTGWQTLLHQLSQTSLERLDIKNNKIDDTNLVLLASISTLKSLDVSGNKLCTPLGWRSFFNSLRTRRAKLVKLAVSSNKVGNEGVAALGSLLRSMITLKTLNMNEMANSVIRADDITSQGWQALFTSMQDSNLDLIELNLGNNSIDDDGLQLLVRLVSTSMSSLKHLNLYDNRGVTPSGWQALTGYLQSPNFALEELHLYNNNVNDDTIIRFVELLAHNKALKCLSLDDCFDDDGNDLITERGWEAISNLVCNKTSIMDTYTSNHTLHDISYTIPNDRLESYLKLNQNEDKVEVARQKILQTHFSSKTPNIQELLDMELVLMPTVIAWIGRPAHVGRRGVNVSGLSLMYNLMRRLPDLFDSSPQKKQAGTKRKSR